MFPLGCSFPCVMVSRLVIVKRSNLPTLAVGHSHAVCRDFSLPVVVVVSGVVFFLSCHLKNKLLL